MAPVGPASRDAPRGSQYRDAHRGRARRSLRGTRPGRVPGGPGAVARPGPSDGSNADDEDDNFRWGAPSRTVVDGAIRAAERGDQAPLGPFPAGGAPVPGAYSGSGPQSPAQYPGAPPQPATPWQPLPDGAWAGGPRPGTPVTGPMLPPAPMPARAPAPSGGGMPPNGMSAGPVGGLIDAPPWLSGPSGPAPAGMVPAGATDRAALPAPRVASRDRAHEVRARLIRHGSVRVHGQARSEVSEARREDHPAGPHRPAIRN